MSSRDPARPNVVFIVSDRDYVRTVTLADCWPRELTLREFMTTSVIVVPPNITRQECMSLMTEHLRRLLRLMD